MNEGYVGFGHVGSRESLVFLVCVMLLGAACAFDRFKASRPLFYSAYCTIGEVFRAKVFWLRASWGR